MLISRSPELRTPLAYIVTGITDIAVGTVTSGGKIDVDISENCPTYSLYFSNV